MRLHPGLPPLPPTFLFYYTLLYDWNMMMMDTSLFWSVAVCVYFFFGRNESDGNPTPKNRKRSVCLIYGIFISKA